MNNTIHCRLVTKVDQINPKDDQERRWAESALKPWMYFEGGVWVPSTDPCGFVSVDTDYIGCYYGDGYASLRLANMGKMYDPSKKQTLELFNQYQGKWWVQFHDADDMYYEETFDDRIHAFQFFYSVVMEQPLHPKVLSRIFTNG